MRAMDTSKDVLNDAILAECQRREKKLQWCSLTLMETKMEKILAACNIHRGLWRCGSKVRQSAVACTHIFFTNSNVRLITSHVDAW